MILILRRLRASNGKWGEIPTFYKGINMQKKVIDSDTAKHFDCCTVDRKCTGDKCMAWVSEPRTLPPCDQTSAVPTIQPSISSGYCGMLFA